MPPEPVVPTVSADRRAAAEGARRRARARERTRLGALAAAGTALAGLAVANALRARAAERRHPPKGRVVEIDGVRVHVRTWGRSGPPVLLLHGNGVDSSDWEMSGLIAALTGHRLIAFDRPGYGHTERPRSRLWTAARQADLAVGLLDALGAREPVVVIGHSWGTLVANALALGHPGRVRGMVQLAGYYVPSERADAWLASPPAIPVLGDALRYTLSPLLGAAIAPKLIAKLFAPRPVPERFAREFSLDLALRPSQIRASAEESGLMVPSAALLSRHYGEIAVPVEILAGDGDEVVTTGRQATAYAHALDDARLTRLSGLGHMLHYFAQAEIAAALGRVTAQGGARPDTPARLEGRSALHA